MIEVIRAIKTDLENAVDRAAEELKDTSRPLEERWNLYLELEEFLPISTSISDSVNVLTEDIYDNLGMEKYETRLNSDIDEQLQENYVEVDEPDEDDWGRNYNQRWRDMYAKRDEWREAVLKEGYYGGFTFDW